VSEINRRQFILRSTAAVTAVASAGIVAESLLTRPRPGFDRTEFPRPSGSSVAVMRASSYDRDLEEIVADGLRAAGADVRGKSVLLKPNLVEFRSTSVINTDPRLIAATIVAMSRMGARSIAVAEGPGHRRDTEAIVEASGLLDALADTRTSFIDLNAAPLGQARLQTRYTGLGQLWLPRPILDSDLVVSMPKLKTHHGVGTTLSLKNCFGCVPGRIYGWPKNVLHWRGVENSILDVATAVRPGLAIIDGIVGMEGDGPINGRPTKAGVLVFSTDPVAADVTAATLMGIDPDRVPYLREAGTFLGQGDLDRIEQRGEDIARNVTRFAPAPGFERLSV
jgi:uncharacterized protein (DUF362 family)